MTARELVVVAADGIGREVIPLAVSVLCAVLPGVRLRDEEAGAGHARRVGMPIEPRTVEMVRSAGAALIGPEAPPIGQSTSARGTLLRALDLYASLYPFSNPARDTDLLLIVDHNPEPDAVSRGSTSLTPMQAWSATRLGNLAGSLVRQGHGRVVIVHDSEEAFAHAVRGGLGESVEVERMDAIYLLNRVSEIAPELDLLVTSAATGALLLPYIGQQVQPLSATGRLLVGPAAAVATPAHGPLLEQVGWGFANPLGAIRAVATLLRYRWGEEDAAHRIEEAIRHTRRRTPDLGGLHTMYEVTRAILSVL